MKIKFSAMLSLIMGLTIFGHAQKIPQGIKKIADTYLQDSLADWGINEAKKGFTIDQTLKLLDFEVGSPIQQYDVKKDLIDSINDSTKLYSLIVPTGEWFIPIRAKGNYIYKLEIIEKTLGFKIIGMTTYSPGSKLFDFRKKYPEASGINPIFITAARTWFFHFPQINSYNLVYATQGFPGDELAKILPSDINSIGSNTSRDDAIKIIRFWKKNWQDDKPRRDQYKKNFPGKPHHRGRK